MRAVLCTLSDSAPLLTFAAFAAACVAALLLDPPETAPGRIG